MSVKLFQDTNEYNATPKPTDESRVGLIKDINKTVIDGINVRTQFPKHGDIVYAYDGEVIFFDYLTHVKNLLPSTYTFVGYVLNRFGNYVYIIRDLETTAQWLGCGQYAITAISSTNITIRLRMSNNYDAYTNVEVTLPDTSINYANAQIISEAVSAKAEEVGDTQPWWAWYDEDNERIVVQTDTYKNRNQSSVAGINCTIALCVWDDMPASSALWKTSGVSATSCIGNPAKFISYYSTHGSTPTAVVALNSGIIVTKASFDSSEYCQILRDNYADYSTYVIAEYSALLPTRYGVFGLLSGKEMTDKYGNATAPTKDGGTMYKFPALHRCAVLDLDVDGLRAGEWWLATPEETLWEMSTDIYSSLRTAATKVGKTYPDNSVYRWCSARFSALTAWLYHGAGGYLSTVDRYHGVNSTYCLRAVTLYKLS